MSIQDIYHSIKVNDQLVTSGQPTEAQLQDAAADGIVTVVNLAPGESYNALANEADVVKSLGMSYHHIPVDWGNPKESDFTAFEQVMHELPEGKTLIHCAANFRVTAFYSLYGQKHLGWSTEQADAFRAQIWQGSNYPIWEQFIAEMKTKISS